MYAEKQFTNALGKQSQSPPTPKPRPKRKRSGESNCSEAELLFLQTAVDNACKLSRRCKGRDGNDCDLWRDNVKKITSAKLLDKESIKIALIIIISLIEMQLRMPEEALKSA
jgi:hypothetical protein